MKPHIRTLIIASLSLISLWLIRTHLRIIQNDKEILSTSQAIKEHQQCLEDLQANVDYKSLKLNSSLKLSNSLDQTSKRLTNGLKDAKQQAGSKILSLDSGKHQLEDIQKTSRKLSEAEEKIASIQKLQSDKSQLIQLISDLTEQKKELIAIQKKQPALSFQETSSPARLKTSVLNVFDTYGFVSIKGGENLGIKPHSILQISRKKKVIAKAIVSHVRATTSVANIIPDSVNTSLPIKAGDAVTSSR